MNEVPQVVLFGSIAGNWREEHVIPVLDELGVTYYNPIAAEGWTKAHGDREADYMARCETIVMVINNLRPAYTSLVETGWAALGAVTRGQHFILQIDLDYGVTFPPALLDVEGGRELAEAQVHYTTATRYLAYQHAKQFRHERLHLVDTLASAVDSLRDIYTPRANV